MNDLVYISRNFTEFGGFAPAEIVDFQKRGILCESDFVRIHGSEAWIPMTDWLTSAVASDTPAPKAAKPKAPAKKKTAKSGTKKEKAAA
jgi:hypothetical protein